MDSFSINSAQGPYTVFFDKGLSGLAAKLLVVPGSLVVIDCAVHDRFGAQLAEVLARTPHFIVQTSEDEKTLEGCSRVLTFLQANNASRQTQIIAIGGGIVQDIVTFCAHVYYRGLNWTYVPTTLLAMADSCIGAKASINFNGFKNQLGVFHSPSAVRICLAFADTLPVDEIRSGYGEIVKLHLVASGEHFARLSNAISSDGWRSPRLEQFVFDSLKTKKSIIEIDEFDNGVRRTLNFGHTFGHALESVTNHGIPHGIGVVWGMDVVNFISMRRGFLSAGDYATLHNFFRTFFGWRLPAEINMETLLSATQRDKKNRDGKLNLVLMTAPGKLDVVPQEYGGQLSSWLSEYLASQNYLSHGN